MYKKAKGKPFIIDDQNRCYFWNLINKSGGESEKGLSASLRAYT